MRDTERVAETQAQAEGEGEEAPCLVSRFIPWAKGGAKPLSHPGCSVFPC